MAPRTLTFDLEDPVSLARLDEPMTALGPLEGLVVSDQVEAVPLDVLGEPGLLFAQEAA